MNINADYVIPEDVEEYFTSKKVYKEINLKSYKVSDIVEIIQGDSAITMTVYQANKLKKLLIGILD